MTGQPVDHGRSTQQYDGTIASLIEQHERFHENFAALARQILDEQRLDETFIDHYDYRQSLGATIIQVMHHNA